MGIRTPDLLHAISRQPVHPPPSGQVIVLGSMRECAVVRPGCGTSALYHFLASFVAATHSAVLQQSLT
jgi:hypothetical protein